jgi:hypothetical protein
MSLTILDCVNDPKIWQPWFKDRKTWGAWFAFLAVLFGHKLDARALATFRACTGRNHARPEGYVDASLVVGRRGGKSIILALIAAYLACFHDWRPFLAPGERASIVVIAADRKQAGSIFRYLKALLSIPLLANLIERETAEALDLTNHVSVEVLTASYRTVRGRTCVACLCDELAFWRVEEDSAQPDAEIINALRPAMATIPRAMLLKASSPYSKRGVLYDDFKRHFGRDDSDVLVWQAATRTMNPAVPQSFIDGETEKDPIAASAEYGAQFRSDIDAFVSREIVEALVAPGRHEIPYITGSNPVAFVDPSGGSADSMTLCICHREGERVVVDAIRERRPPFSPEDVVEEFAALLKRYRIRTIYGDRYAGEWPREQFRKRAIEYRIADRPKSDLYRDLLPSLNSGLIELLDHPRLVNQLCGLERRTARGGRDSIDHAPGSHDDIANACAGAIVYAAKRSFQNLKFVPPPLCDGKGVWTQTSVQSAEPSGADKANAQRPPSHWTKNGQPSEPWRDYMSGPGLNRNWWGPA